MLLKFKKRDKIQADPNNVRIDSYLAGFENLEDATEAFSEFYRDESVGRSELDFFGIKEKLWWFVCKKR